MSCIHLIRHAKAKNRARWTEPDELRPLTKRGRNEAELLATALAAIPFVRLVSSPYVRCVQTLEPLAAELQLPIEEAAELAEGQPGEAAVDLMLEEAKAGAVACCTHGDVLFDVVERLSREGARLDAGPLAVPVAGAWVLDVVAGHVTRGRYVAPPSRD